MTVPIAFFLKNLIHKSPISDTIFGSEEYALSPIILELPLYRKSRTGTVLIFIPKLERRKLVYGLKHQIAKAGKYVGEEAVQLHGGMGVTEEMSVGHYLKRLLVITNIFGSSDYFLDKYIDS